MTIRRYDEWLRSQFPGAQSRHFFHSTTRVVGRDGVERGIGLTDRLREPGATYLRAAWLCGYLRGMELCAARGRMESASPLPLAAADMAEASGTRGGYPDLWGGWRGLRRAVWPEEVRVGEVEVETSAGVARMPQFAVACGPPARVRTHWSPSRVAALWVFGEAQRLGMTPCSAARAITMARSTARRMLGVRTRRCHDMELAARAWSVSVGLRAPAASDDSARAGE